jgi:hypothetical protein
MCARPGRPRAGLALLPVGLAACPLMLSLELDEHVNVGLFVVV